MDHTINTGRLGDTELLVRTYDDGAVTVSTRPVGGDRWSPETVLAAEPVQG